MINYLKKINFKKLKFRFPPDPNGFLHLGHIFNIYINFFLSKNKKTNFIIRFDDTNLSKIKFFFYKYIIFDLLWLGIKWNKINYFNNEIRIFNKILIFYIKKKKIFFKKKVFFLRINLHFLNYVKIIDFFLYKVFFKKKYIYIIKNKIIFRKKKIKNHWNIFPTYDFSQCYNDYLNKINLSICTNEFLINSKIYNFLIKKIKKKPIQIEFEKKKLKFLKLSKRNLKNYFLNIFYFRKIKINPKNLLYFSNILGISKKKSYLNNNDLIKSINIEKKFFINIFFYYYKNKILNFKKNIIYNFFLNKKNINKNTKNLFLILLKNNINTYNFFIINNIFIFKKKFLIFNYKTIKKILIILKKK